MRLRLSLYHQSSQQLIRAQMVPLHDATFGTFPRGRGAWLDSGFAYKTGLVKIKLRLVDLQTQSTSPLYTSIDLATLPMLSMAAVADPSLAVVKYFLLAYSDEKRLKLIANSFQQSKLILC